MALEFIKQDIYLAVDNVVFSIIKGELHVLLIQRIHAPGKWQRALPGGFVHNDESLKEAAYRELAEETNVKNLYLEQLYTFSAVDRDPRGRVVSTMYMAIVNHKNISIKAGSDAGDVSFFSIKDLPKLAFDHKFVIDYALQRLQYKLEYTNVAQYFLPAQFTLSDLQEVYQIVFGQEFDVRNFRKKILKLRIVRETGFVEQGVQHRPAKLYEFVDKDIKIVEVVGIQSAT